MNKNRIWYLSFTAWVLSFIATLGSLFFSEVMGFPPCVLCWYQRICMYPLSILLIAALFPPSKDSFKFTLPLNIIGIIIAIYHNLLYYNILPEAAAPCSQGISCTTTFINWAGFITIPLLSLIAFSTIFTIQIFLLRSFRNEK